MIVNEYIKSRIIKKSDIVLRPIVKREDVKDEDYMVIKLRKSFAFEGELIDKQFIFSFSNTLTLFNHFPELKVTIIRGDKVHFNFDFKRTYKYYLKEY